MQEESVQRVRDILEKSGTTQTHLANKLGMQRQALHRLLKTNVTRSKYFPEIAKALGVTEDYLMYGGRPQVLVVDDAGLRELLQNHFTLPDDEKIKLKDLFVKAKAEGCYFAHELTVGIDETFKTGSLAVYFAKAPKTKTADQIYLVLSSLNNSFVVGRYGEDKRDKFLKNANGKYYLQPNDRFIAVAVQITAYLGEHA